MGISNDFGRFYV